MTTEQQLQYELEMHNCYAIADRTAAPASDEYKQAQKANRQRIRQLCFDIRWYREKRPGLPPLVSDLDRICREFKAHMQAMSSQQLS